MDPGKQQEPLEEIERRLEELGEKSERENLTSAEIDELTALRRKARAERKAAVDEIRKEDPALAEELDSRADAEVNRAEGLLRLAEAMKHATSPDAAAEMFVRYLEDCEPEERELILKITRQEMDKNEA